MESDEFKTCKSIPSTTIQSWEDLQRLVPENQETVVSYNDVHSIKSEILRLMALVPKEQRLYNVRQLAQNESHWLFRIFGRQNFQKFKHLWYDNLKCSMQVFQNWMNITPEDCSVFENGFQTHNPTWPSNKCLQFDFMCVALFYNQLSSSEARQRGPRFKMPTHKLFFCFNDWSSKDWIAFSREKFAHVRGARKDHDENALKLTDSPAATQRASISIVAKVGGSAQKQLRPKLLRAALNDVSEAQSAVMTITLQYPDGNVYIDVADPMVFLSEYVMIDVFSDCEKFQVTMETIHNHFSFQKFPSPVILTWKDCDFFGTPKRDFEVSELLLIIKGKRQEDFVACTWEECIRKLFFKYSYLVKDYFNWVDRGKPNLVYVDTFVMVDLDDPDRFLLKISEEKDIRDLSKHLRVMDRSGRRFPSVEGDRAQTDEQEEKEESKSEYEIQREERMKSNDIVLKELGVIDSKPNMESGVSDKNKRLKTSNSMVSEEVPTRFLRSDNTTLRHNDPMRCCFLSDEQHNEFLSHLQKCREESTGHPSCAAASSSKSVEIEACKESGVPPVEKSAAPSTLVQKKETCLDDSFDSIDWSVSSSPANSLSNILEGDGDHRALGLDLPSSFDVAVETTASSANTSTVSMTISSAQPLSAPSVETTAAPKNEQNESQDKNVGDGSVSAAADELEDKSADPNDDIAKEKPDNSSSVGMVSEPSGSAESGQEVADSNESVASVSAKPATINVDANTGVEIASKTAVVSNPGPTMSTNDKSATEKMEAEVSSIAQQDQEAVKDLQDKMQVESAVVVVQPAAMPTGDFPQLLQSINVALSNAFNSQRTQASAAQARCQQQQDVLQAVSRGLTDVCSDLDWVLKEVQAFQSSGSSQLVLSQMEQSIAEKRSAIEDLDQNLESKTGELNHLQSEIRKKKQEDKRLDAQKAVLDLAEQEKNLALQNEKDALEERLRAEFQAKEQAFLEKERAMQAEFQAREQALKAQNSDLERQSSAKDMQFVSLQKQCDNWRGLADVRQKIIEKMQSKSVPSSEVSGATGAASGRHAQAKRSDSSSLGTP